MRCGISDLWILYFQETSSREQLLNIMRYHIMNCGELDKLIFNNQAKLLNCKPLDTNSQENRLL